MANELDKTKRMDLAGTQALVQDVMRRYKQQVSDQKADLVDGKIPLSQMPVQETTVIDNNGHEYVDLALPSGTLWAKFSLKDNPVENAWVGDYFAYGQTDAGEPSSAYSGTEAPLSLEHDAARQKWGGGWHIPTGAQILELFTLSWDVVSEYYDEETQQFFQYPGIVFQGADGSETHQAEKLYIPFAGYYNHQKGQTSDVETTGYLLSASYAGDNQSSEVIRLPNFDTEDFDIGMLSRLDCFTIRPCLEPTVVQKLPVGDQLKDDALIDDYSYYNGSTLVENQRGRILSPNVMYDLDLTQSEDNTSYGMTFLLPIMNDDGVLYKTGYVPQTSPDFTHGQVWWFMFTAPSSGTMPTLSLLSGVSGASIVWKDTLTIEAGKTYEISVVYNKRQNKYYASACAFTNS